MKSWTGREKEKRKRVGFGFLIHDFRWSNARHGVTGVLLRCRFRVSPYQIILSLLG